jgi:PLP dependent protein
MTDIESNIRLLREEIPSSVKIVAVSKTRPVSDILIAYDAGQRVFGENRVQELVSKKEKLPLDIEWHFIGHLQSNKTRQLIRDVALIHSVDSFRLLSVLNSESQKTGVVTECLIQFHIAREDTKFGFSMDEAVRMLGSSEFSKMKNITVRGVMGMATFTADMAAVREEFRFLKRSFDLLKNGHFAGCNEFSEISMGMSGDFRVAILEGATIVRIGSLIFGERLKV